MSEIDFRHAEVLLIRLKLQGSKLMRDLIAALGCRTEQSFYRHIGELTDAERYSALFDLVQSRTYDPFRLTPGYRALGALIYERFFDVVLTTNMDPLLVLPEAVQFDPGYCINAGRNWRDSAPADERNDYGRPAARDLWRSRRLPRRRIVPSTVLP